MAFEIVSEHFSETGTGLPGQYHLIDLESTPPMGMSVAIYDNPETTTLAPGRIYEGPALAFDRDKGFKNETDSHIPRQLPRAGSPVIFRGPSSTANIVVEIGKVLDGDPERREMVRRVATYAAEVTRATIQLEDICPPFGVTMADRPPEEQ